MTDRRSRTQFFYFQSQKDLDAMVALLKSKMPGTWNQAEESYGTPAHIDGGEVDRFGILICEVEGHPGVFKISIACFAPLNPQTFDYDRFKNQVFDALGVKEVPKPD